MVQDHKFLMVQDMVLDHKARPNFQKALRPGVQMGTDLGWEGALSEDWRLSHSNIYIE